MKRRIWTVLGSIAAFGVLGGIGAQGAHAFHFSQNVAGKQVTVATFSHPHFDYVLVGVATPPGTQDATVRVDCFGNGTSSDLYVTYVVANDSTEVGPLGELPSACPAIP